MNAADHTPQCNSATQLESIVSGSTNGEFLTIESHFFRTDPSVFPLSLAFLRSPGVIGPYVHLVSISPSTAGRCSGSPGPAGALRFGSCIAMLNKEQMA